MPTLKTLEWDERRLHKNPPDGSKGHTLRIKAEFEREPSFDPLALNDVFFGSTDDSFFAVYCHKQDGPVDVDCASGAQVATDVKRAEPAVEAVRLTPCPRDGRGYGCAVRSASHSLVHAWWTALKSSCVNAAGYHRVCERIFQTRG